LWWISLAVSVIRQRGRAVHWTSLETMANGGVAVPGPELSLIFCLYRK